MRIQEKPIGILAAAGVASLLLMPQLAMSENNAKYTVTITNLTAGQPLTPPVLVTHSNRTGIFDVGEEANMGIQEIAENGNSVPLVTALHGDVHVYDIVEGMAPIIPANNPGGAPFDSTVSLTIATHGNARYLPFVSMLICTNDGFTGIDTVRLPSRSRTVCAAAYDARAEMNTENLADMVPPCQGLIGVTGEMGTGMSNPLLAEDGIVIPHAGINGGADLLPDVHN